MIFDNASYHYADIVKIWLEMNNDKYKIELHFLPVYSPDFDAQECLRRLTCGKATNYRYFNEFEELHKALFQRFNR